MEIRLATLKDYDAFNDMYIHFPEDFLLDKMPLERFRPYVTRNTIYLAVEEEEIVGYAIVFSYSNGTADIIQFYVTKKLSGYGKEFYKLLEKEIRTKNIRTVYVQCFQNKKERFWQGNGYLRFRSSDKFFKELK